MSSPRPQRRKPKGVVPDGDRDTFEAILRAAVPDERESRQARRRKGKKEKVQD